MKSIPSNRFRCVIAPSAKDAIQEEKRCTTPLRIYTDGSRSPQGVGAAAIVFKNGHRMGTMKIRLGSAGSFTEHQAELAGLIAALVLALRWPHLHEVVIFTDSQPAIRAISRRTAYPLVGEFYRELLRLLREHPQKMVTLHWIPGHENIAGNVCADKEARRAAIDRAIATNEQAPKSLRKVLGGDME